VSRAQIPFLEFPSIRNSFAAKSLFRSVSSVFSVVHPASACAAFGFPLSAFEIRRPEFLRTLKSNRWRANNSALSRDMREPQRITAQQLRISTHLPELRIPAHLPLCNFARSCANEVVGET
jgi:hypothetical protein